MVHRVDVAETAESFEVEDGETILAAALRSNVMLAHDCQLGGCGTCRVKILEGAVSYDEPPLALTPEEESEGFALACQGRPSCDLVISPWRVQIELLPSMRHNAKITSVRPVSPLVTHLVLEVPDMETLDYRPGQYMNIIMPDGGTRCFSMASKPAGNKLDFHVRRVVGGKFTDGQLLGVQPGDTLEVELPLGSFHFQMQDYRPLLMIATGTGLAPIKAILESLMDDVDCPPVSLYWGTRTAADLYIHEEILAWQSRLYEFKYVPVLSRADAAWTGRRGYVQDAVAADWNDLSEHAIYLCGSPEMIFAAKRSFIALHASTSHIYSEGFTHRENTAA